MSRSLAACALLLLTRSACASADAWEEEEGEDQREMSFASEHKTGHVFGVRVMECLVPRNGRTREEWERTERTKSTEPLLLIHLMPPEWGKTVYMMRNPYEMVRSNYFHSVECEHKWMCLTFETIMLMPAKQALTMFGPLAAPVREALPNETWNDYLHRVSMADGIQATMAGHAYHILTAMEAHFANNGGQERISFVCLDDAFRAFDKTLQLILQNFGFPADKEVQRCLKAQDPSTRNFPHGTHNVEESARREAMSIIKDHDAKYFGGHFGRSAIASFCGQQGLT